jgi:hypothetical protein
MPVDGGSSHLVYKTKDRAYEGDGFPIETDDLWASYYR